MTGPTEVDSQVDSSNVPAVPPPDIATSARRGTCVHLPTSNSLPARFVEILPT
jgi:hypothetical protein